jgi:acetate kinase
MSILVLNAGSTSLKFGLFAEHADESLLAGSIDWASGDRHAATLSLRMNAVPPLTRQVDVPDDHAAALAAIDAVVVAVREHPAQLGQIDAVGHRVVHGGTEYSQSALIDQRVKQAIDRMSAVAPLHNPPALEAIRAAEAALPGTPQVAVFDTAFYAELPARAHVYPLPYSWYTDWGVRRFGFHGISHQYCSARAAEMLDRPLASLRIISCHLGGGCSAVAIQDGKPRATTMGFTPLEGLMMGSRPGSLDPGILLYVQRNCGLTLAQIDDALNHDSGLLGISGISPDLAPIEAAAAQGNPRAKLALEMFVERVRAAIGGLAVTLGGIDVLSFTDRIGENSATLRTLACDGLECLGVRLDPAKNAACRADLDVALPESAARILVLHTREELMIAREARRFAKSKGKS